MWFLVIFLNMFLDSFYISFFNRIKKQFGKKAIGLSQLYITFLEGSFMILLVCFFAAFANQMKMDLMSSSKGIVLGFIVLLFIYFKNWMKYTGKKRNILNAKRKKSDEPFWKLMIVPIVFLVLSLIFIKSI